MPDQTFSDKVRSHLAFLRLKRPTVETNSAVIVAHVDYLMEQIGPRGAAEVLWFLADEAVEKSLVSVNPKGKCNG